MDNHFFDNWNVLLRTLIIAVLGYAILLVFLRISGKRTLSKMNAFDFVVTIALGSTLASLLLSKDVALAQGALALGLLVGFQFLITWSSVRWPWLRRYITGEPTLLLHEGRLLPRALRRARVTESEVRAALRSAGLGGVGEARAVVLETDGTFSVIRRGDDGDSALEGLEAPGRF